MLTSQSRIRKIKIRKNLWEVKKLIYTMYFDSMSSNNEKWSYLETNNRPIKSLTCLSFLQGFFFLFGFR